MNFAPLPGESSNRPSALSLAPFATPDGYPDKAAPVLATLLWRWNLAFALASNSVPSVTTPLQQLLTAIDATRGNTAEKLFRHFNGHDADERQMQALAAVTNTTDQAALILSSPAFQRC